MYVRGETEIAFNAARASCSDFFSFRKYNAQMKRPSGKFTSRNRLNFRRRDEDKSWL
jgi:hypothetical protein